MSFGDIGGLDHYIRALKEMVFLPLARPVTLPAPSDAVIYRVLS